MALKWFKSGLKWPNSGLFRPHKRPCVMTPKVGVDGVGAPFPCLVIQNPAFPSMPCFFPALAFHAWVGPVCQRKFL